MNHFFGLSTIGLAMFAGLCLGCVGEATTPDMGEDTQESTFAETTKADVEKPCVNTSSGLPFVEGDAVVCRIQRTLDKTTAPDMIDRTNKLVKKIEVEADLRFAVKPANTIGGLRHTLQLDPQKIKGKIHTAFGISTTLRMTVAPKAVVTGSSICDLKLESIDLGIQNIDTGLPDFVDNLLKTYIKSNTSSIEKQARESMEKSLLPLQNASCDVKPAVSVGDPYQPDARLEAVRLKAQNYLAWGKQNVDEHGWISDTHCDGLLMNSLYAAAGGPAEIPLAYYGDGRWDRHWKKDCYPHGSKSTISRDMMAGLMQWMLSNPRPELVEQMITYGEQHTFQGLPLVWIMGQGELGRVDQPPAFISKMYAFRERMTGKPSPYPSMGIGTFGECESYECHLSVLDVLFYARFTGTLSESAQAHLQHLADSRPRNALFNIIYGKYAQSSTHFQRALDVLLDTSLFPADRLPTNHDRCNDYIFSREPINKDGTPNRNWLPCPDESLKVFTGVDLLFASAIALDQVK